MAQILPRDLPPVPGGIVNPASANIVDDGSGVWRATPQQIVDSGAPVSSQGEAEAGLVNTGRMTPLRTAQAIAALGVSPDVFNAAVTTADGQEIRNAIGVLLPSAAAFLASSDITSDLEGLRAWTQDGIAWDIVDPVGADWVHPVTGVGLNVVKPLTGLAPLWAFGGGMGGDDTQPFVRSMNLQGAIIGRAEDTYRLLQKIEIDKDVVIDWHGATVAIGPVAGISDSNRNVLTLSPGCDLFEMRNCGGVELNWTDADDGSCGDFVSAFDSMDSVYGFPAGVDMTYHMPALVVIENNELGSARIALGVPNVHGEASESIVRVIGNRQTGADPIFTYGFYFSNLVGLQFEQNRLACNYIMVNPDFINNRDMMKVTGLYSDLAHILDNIFEPTSADTWCQVDVYAGANGATIRGNTFRNAHLERKTSASGGIVPMIETDEITGNKWFVDRDPGATSLGLFYIGRMTNIHSNSMWIDPTLTLSGTSITFMFLDDNGSSPVSPNTAPYYSCDLTLANNIMTAEGATGGNIVMFNIQARTDGPAEDQSRKPTVIGNIMRGGDRFLTGSAGILVGNTWTTERTFSSHTTVGNVQAANDMPATAEITGKDTGRRGFTTVSSGTSLAAERQQFFRLTTPGVTIASISGGVPGQIIQIYNRSGTSTITHSANIQLKGAVDAVMTGRCVLTLMKVPDADTGWQEVSRSF